MEKTFCLYESCNSVEAEIDCGIRMSISLSSEIGTGLLKISKPVKSSGYSELSGFMLPGDKFI